MSAPSTAAAALASLLDSAPSWLPQVDHWEIAEDTDTWVMSGQLAGDPREAEAFRLLAPMMERATVAHSDDGRLVTVPFEWDGVPGQVWYLRPVERYIVPERCATCPTPLAGAGTQFVRLGSRGAPVICVPCRDRMYEAWVREAAVRELGALPMPVGTAADAELDVAVDSLAAYVRLRLALASAQRGRRELRARVAELEAAPTTVYRASHDSIPMGLYTTAAEARAHCEADERRSWMTGTTLSFDWIEDDGVAELVVTAGQNEESTTNYVVEALEAASKYDAEADE